MPFLFGLNDMAALDVHFCCRSGSFIIPGPGGLKVEASPGTTRIQMDKCNHWHLPLGNPRTSKRNSYLVEPWTESQDKPAEEDVLARLNPANVVADSKQASSH